MKRIVFLFLAIVAAFAFSFMVGAVTAEELPDYDPEEISIFVDGTQLQCPVAPFIDNGRTLVPMRAIFERLEAVVEWEGTTRTITATKGETVIIMQIGNAVLTKNGVEETMDVAPVIVGGSTFVPLRAVSQALGTTVDWFGNMRTASITSADKAPVELFVIFNGDGLVKKATKAQVEEVKNSGWIVSNFDQVTLYDENNAQHTVFDYETISLIKKGWSTQPITVTMYAADGRTLEVLPKEVSAHEKVGWYTEPVVLMYSKDGRTMLVKQSNVYAQSTVGWYKEPPMVTLYNLDGEEINVLSTEISAYREKGWYTERIVVPMYTADGRWQYFEQSKVAAQSTVGWTTEPIYTKMHDGYGTVIEVPLHDVGFYEMNGWYLYKTSQTGNSNGGSGVSVPSYDKGYGVWVPTNGGTKYHSKSTCSKMIDPVQIPKEDAISRGYTACGRCY